MAPRPQSRDTSFDGAPPTNSDKEKLAKVSKDDRLSGDGYEDEKENYFYNSRTQELLGRTIGSWTLLICYFVCFTCFLTAFWGLWLWIFYQTLDNYTPKLTLDEGHIGTNPGLGYRPIDASNSQPYSSLIWFTHGGDGTWGDIKRNIDGFLVEYEPGYWANAGASQTKCHWDRGPLTKEEACEFNLEWLSDPNSDIKCISDEYYGYYHGKPCILVKLNRIYGWMPQPYRSVEEVDAIEGFPESLKQHINDTYRQNCEGKAGKHENCPELNMVWLHCDGEEAPDKENIGTVTYTPWRGFPTYYFPYYNQLGYLQPIVMIQLKNPTPGVIINIECTAWARGIEHDRGRRRGSLHIEFIMD